RASPRGRRGLQGAALHRLSPHSAQFARDAGRQDRPLHRRQPAPADAFDAGKRRLEGPRLENPCGAGEFRRQGLQDADAAPLSHLGQGVLCRAGIRSPLMETLLPLAAEVAELLKKRGESIALSESSMGGLVSVALVAQPGASAFYLGSTVIYT